MANPYEIRSHLLKQAQEHLTQQYHANMQMAQDILVATADTATYTAETYKKLMPQFPTITDILDQATKLQEFVDGMYK